MPRLRGRLRIAVLGTGGPLTQAVLGGLAGQVEVSAVVLRQSVPATALRQVPRRGAVLLTRSAADLARRHGIDVWETPPPPDAGLPHLLQQRAVEVLVMACWPWRLPRAWYAAVPGGTVNVHPSLLPAYRGREPLRAQAEAGEAHTGVSLHLVDEGYDTGPILWQERVRWPAGADRAAVEHVLGRAAAEALVRLLLDWPAACARARPQPRA